MSVSFKFKIQQYRLAQLSLLPKCGYSKQFYYYKINLKLARCVYECDYEFELVSMHEMSDKICGSSAFYAQIQTHFPIRLWSESSANNYWFN